jgi:hypothetical protein
MDVDQLRAAYQKLQEVISDVEDNGLMLLAEDLAGASGELADYIYTAEVEAAAQPEEEELAA